jgi:diphthamide biosynthesis protein 2
MTGSEQDNAPVNGAEDGRAEDLGNDLEGHYDAEGESAPPEFDLRTGRYVSRTRPMQGRGRPATASQSSRGSQSGAVARRAKGDLLAANGVASPGAEYLRTRRTWQGLGSDFEVAHDEAEEEYSSAVQEGRTGIARGYTVANCGRT